MTKVSKCYHISRMSLLNWLKKGVENLSRKPVTSPHQCNGDREKLICAVYDDDPWKSKRAIARDVTVITQQKTSTNCVIKVLKRNNKIPDAPIRPEGHITRSEPRRLACMDAKRVENGFLFTVKDVCSKDTYDYLCNRQSSKNAAKALRRAVKALGKFNEVHTDNGPEFQGFFDIYCLLKGIKHSHTGFYNPRGNGPVESYFGTLKRELLKKLKFRGIKLQREILELWNIFYNFFRPQVALGNRTPKQILGEELPQELENRITIVDAQVGIYKYQKFIFGNRLIVAYQRL